MQSNAQARRGAVVEAIAIADVEGAPIRSTSVIAVEIRKEYAACERDAHSAVEHAIRCGLLLIEVKAEAGHGCWLPWLAANFPASERTAQNFMGLAREGNTQRVADLPLREALAELAIPRPAPKPRAIEPTEPEPAEVVADADEPDGDVVDDGGAVTPVPGSVEIETLVRNFLVQWESDAILDADVETAFEEFMWPMFAEADELPAEIMDPAKPFLDAIAEVSDYITAEMSDAGLYSSRALKALKLLSPLLRCTKIFDAWSEYLEERIKEAQQVAAALDEVRREES